MDRYHWTVVALMLAGWCLLTAWLFGWIGSR